MWDPSKDRAARRERAQRRRTPLDELPPLRGGTRRRESDLLVHAEDAGMTAVELYGRDDCQLCGEPLPVYGEVAEMYDPDAECTRAIQLGDAALMVPPSYICHAQCGLDKGYELA